MAGRERTGLNDEAPLGLTMAIDCSGRGRVNAVTREETSSSPTCVRAFRVGDHLVCSLRHRQTGDILKKFDVTRNAHR